MTSYKIEFIFTKMRFLRVGIQQRENQKFQVLDIAMRPTENISEVTFELIGLEVLGLGVGQKPLEFVTFLHQLLLLELEAVDGQLMVGQRLLQVRCVGI